MRPKDNLILGPACPILYSRQMSIRPTWPAGNQQGRLGWGLPTSAAWRRCRTILVVNRRSFLLPPTARAGAPTLPQSAAELPANAVRSVQRLFTSEIEDKPWFYDREMWPRYLAMLAENRFNRDRK